MKQVAGFWLPDGEVDLVPFLESSPRFFKGPTYQVDKLLACLPWIKKFDLALDVGAHCGLWSRVLVKMFKAVEAFEPVLEHRQCFARNVPEAKMHGFALGDDVGRVCIEQQIEASGNSAIGPHGTFQVELRPLDTFEAIGPADFIKIDCEGFEYFVLSGGERVIMDCRPCVIVEQKKGMGSKYGLSDFAAVDLLKSWGAKERFDMSGDYCLSWD